MIKIVNQTVPVGPEAPRLREGRDPRHRRVHRRARHHRGRAAPQARAPAGLRLRVQAGSGQPFDPLHGSPEDARRGAAVHLRRDLEDDQHAGGVDAGGDRAGLHRGLEAGPEGGRDLPRRLQAQPAAVDRRRRRRRVARRRLDAASLGCRQLSPCRCPAAASSRTSAARSPTSSRSTATRATSRSALYDDGQPGEIFLVMAKEGSTISGLMDAFATSISLALQYGVPLKALVDKFSHTRFEPSGFTKNPEIPIAKSITDYIFRWLASKFLSAEEKQAVGVILRDPDADRLDGELPGRRLAARRSRAPRVAARPRSSIRPTLRAATSAARSWCATVPATSARTAARRAGAAEVEFPTHATGN